MKKGIHPQYYPDAKVICACGQTWTTGSTKKEIRTDMCSVCHPFFTGEQRIVDTAGQVEPFNRWPGDFNCLIYCTVGLDFFQYIKN
ncbi:MAG: 50S ribosomal protein L31 [candidate division WOR-3 bacterium]